MLNVTRRRGLVVFIVITIIAVATLFAACSKSDSTTTTGGLVTTSSLASSRTIVVDGKTTQEYEAEIPELQKTVKADPQDLVSLQELAIAQLNTGKYDDAIATYGQMLAVKDDGPTHNNLGNVYKRQGNNQLAGSEYQKAINLDPTLTVAYVNLAALFIKVNDNTGAINVLKAALDKVSETDKASLQQYIDSLTSTTTTTAT